MLNLIGNGVVIDPITLGRELSNLEKADVNYHDRLLIAAQNAGFGELDCHRLMEGRWHGNNCSVQPLHHQ